MNEKNEQYLKFLRQKGESAEGETFHTVQDSYGDTYKILENNDIQMNSGEIVTPDDDNYDLMLLNMRDFYLGQEFDAGELGTPSKEPTEALFDRLGATDKALTESAEEAQNRRKNIALGGITAGEILSFLPYAFKPEYIKGLEEQVKEGVDVKGIAEQARKTAGDVIRAGQAAAGEFKKDAEATLAAKGSDVATSARQATEATKATAKALIEQAQNVRGMAIQQAHALEAAAEAELRDAKQAVFASQMQRKKAFSDSMRGVQKAFAMYMGESSAKISKNALEKKLGVDLTPEQYNQMIQMGLA